MGGADDGETVHVLGADSRTHEPLTAPLDAAALVRGLAPEPPPGHRPTPGEPGFDQVVTGDDPRAVGWIVVVGGGDLQRRAILGALAPLREWRLGGDPLVYEGEDPLDWVETHLTCRPVLPLYILLAGSPTHLPFALQRMLANYAAVGRLDLSYEAGDGRETQDIDALRRYAERVVAAEGRSGDGGPRRPVVTWAPDWGGGDATTYSRRLLAAPLATHLADGGVAVNRLEGEAATSGRLIEAVVRSDPVLLFTASHGIGVEQHRGRQAQQAENGTLLGSDRSPFGAGDLPAPEVPFVEDGVVFQFACFGYGTTTRSPFHHWVPRIADYRTPNDFVAALPKRALAHPRGPLGYIAHLDAALLSSIRPRPQDGAGTDRIADFRVGVDRVVSSHRIGFVLAHFGRTVAGLATYLAEQVDHQRRDGHLPDTRFIARFLRHNDARNHLLLGDPAARPRGTA